MADADRLPDCKATRRIYQDVMDRFNHAYFHSDLDTMTALMHLPVEIATFDSRMVLRTRDDLFRMMDAVRRMIDKENVTTYLRVCIAARHLDADTIDGTHESHVLNGMRYVHPRFPVRCLLRRFDGLWKVVSAEHAVEDDSFVVPAIIAALSHAKTTDFKQNGFPQLDPAARIPHSGDDPDNDQTPTA